MFGPAQRQSLVVPEEGQCKSQPSARTDRAAYRCRGMIGHLARLDRMAMVEPIADDCTECSLSVALITQDKLLID